MNVFASPVCGVLKKDDAGPVSITRPRWSMMISPASRRASPRSWVDITTLMPRWLTAQITSSIALVPAGSRLCGGLVKEQYGGVACERTRKREALLLASGQPAGRTVSQVFEAN